MGCEVVKPATEITREKIFAFEDELKKFEQYDFPIEHHFSDGIYLRRMFIPKGACLTGAIHRHAHLNICTGDISVLTEDGMKRFTGQHVLLSSAGIKRIGYAHADTTWITVHLNVANEQDIAKLEHFYVTNDYAQIEGPGK